MSMDRSQLFLNCAGSQLDLSYPGVMGILNVTPDSFSDGGRFVTPERAMQHVENMCNEGAVIIDVGGESTRPGAARVAVQQELDRVIPVIEAIYARFDVVISIDTSKPEVMQAAVRAGARFINDVNALQADNALLTAARLKVPVCLMHKLGDPATMQTAPQYGDVVREVKAFLEQRRAACVQAGIAADQIVLDPGFGFGKTVQHNLNLFAKLPELVELGSPVLVGASRKSMIGHVLDLPVESRLPGGLALAGLAVWLGARLIRSHDVAATVQAVKMAAAVAQTYRQAE